MGLIGRLSKTGIGLLAAGFLLVIVVPPLGFLVARVGLLLLGTVVLVAVAAAVLTLLAIISEAVAEPEPETDHSEPPWRLLDPAHQLQQARRSATRSDPDPVRRDLDVATIDDYRR